MRGPMLGISTSRWKRFSVFRLVRRCEGDAAAGGQMDQDLGARLDPDGIGAAQLKRKTAAAHLVEIGVTEIMPCGDLCRKDVVTGPAREHGILRPEADYD